MSNLNTTWRQSRHRSTLRASRDHMLTKAVVETLENRQMLSGLPTPENVADLTVITSRNQTITLDGVIQGPLPFPFTAGQPKEELLEPDDQRLVGGFAGGNWALARYNPDGMLDLSFGGGDGKVTTDFGTPSDRAMNFSLRPDGKIVGMGLTNASGNDWRFALVRYNSDGSLDTTFGVDGKLLTGLGRAPGFGCVTVLLADGRIHVTGWADGRIKAMEYDANGRNGFERVSPQPLVPSSTVVRHAPRPGTLEYYMNSPFVGPLPLQSQPLQPSDLATVEAGQTFTLALSEGKGRVIDWGPGQTPQ